ncbi:urease accessory protein UreF [mine drainage metagenome]|uniref:Urease accessory protein UreF n=1 Tax=mine drainage metagenome TaxID=410659 RepID=A0A1J5P8F4_9ZZZZ
MPLPIAIAAAARTLALAPVEVIALTLHAFTSNLVQVGVRFIPLGQTAGQGVLAALHPLILRIAAKATTVPLNAIGSGAIRADLAAMQHETLDVRIFRT